MPIRIKTTPLPEHTQSDSTYVSWSAKVDMSAYQKWYSIPGERGFTINDPQSTVIVTIIGEVMHEGEICGVVQTSGLTTTPPIPLMFLTKTLLTADEHKALDYLKQAYELFTQLPVQHPMHQLEFTLAIHPAQRLILSRPTSRAEGLVIDKGEDS